LEKELDGMLVNPDKNLREIVGRHTVDKLGAMPEGFDSGSEFQPEFSDFQQYWPKDFLLSPETLVCST